MKRRLLKAGWYVVRQGKGSHVLLGHSDREDLIVVPDHGSKEVGSGLANKILKKAGLKRI